MISVRCGQFTFSLSAMCVCVCVCVCVFNKFLLSHQNESCHTDEHMVLVLTGDYCLLLDFVFCKTKYLLNET